MSQTPRVPLSGSERAPLPGARAIGPVDPNQRFEVTVLLKGRSDAGTLQGLAREAGSAMPTEKPRLSREAYASAHGATTDAIDRVRQFGRAHDLDVVEADAAKRSVVLTGTAANFAVAFG